MTQSHNLFEAAKKHIPGGVNSPVRAFNGVGGDPVFFKKGEGAYVIDEDDNKYIDYVGSWGPMILGHTHPDVIAAVKAAADCGLSFGAPTVIETTMADKVCELVPSMDMVRMVNSGTEATMMAVRLARAFTGRETMLRFRTHFHGWNDHMPSGQAGHMDGTPTPGVIAGIATQLAARFNIVDQLRPGVIRTKVQAGRIAFLDFDIETVVIGITDRRRDNTDV